MYNEALSKSINQSDFCAEIANINRVWCASCFHLTSLARLPIMWICVCKRVDSTQRVGARTMRAGVHACARARTYGRVRMRRVHVRLALVHVCVLVRVRVRVHVRVLMWVCACTGGYADGSLDEWRRARTRVHACADMCLCLHA